MCLGYRLTEELRQFVCVESCGNRVLKTAALARTEQFLTAANIGVWVVFP
jgi:hypothetical protein